jgi:hypothetical protein
MHILSRSGQLREKDEGSSGKAWPRLGRDQIANAVT